MTSTDNKTTAKSSTKAQDKPSNDVQTTNGQKLETKPAEGDAEKANLTPSPEHNNVSQPGPTSFATDPQQAPKPSEEALKNENTPRENVGPIPGNNVSAERIVQVWDGGERIVAAKMANASTKAEREKAAKARPELQRYIAGDAG